MPARDDTFRTPGSLFRHKYVYIYKHILPKHFIPRRFERIPSKPAQTPPVPASGVRHGAAPLAGDTQESTGGFRYR